MSLNISLNLKIKKIKKGKKMRQRKRKMRGKEGWKKNRMIKESGGGHRRKPGKKKV